VMVFWWVFIPWLQCELDRYQDWVCHIPYFGPVFPSLLSPSVHYPIWSDVWIQSNVHIRSDPIWSTISFVIPFLFI
jgi:hypothetical protein